MSIARKFRRAAAVVAACAVPALAFAAAPVGIEPELPAAEAAAAAPVVLYELDTEMVVHDWVLCASQAFAEQLARAREESAEKAWAAYAELKDARSCGQFAELRVILQERLYASTAESGHGARVFAGLVSFSDSWASVYLVSGGLPQD